jgi:hypothetical protein
MIRTRWSAIRFFLVCLSVAGCSSIKSGSVLEALKGIGSTKKSPITEAFIEYAGPHSQWAGPGSLLVYVDLKDSVATRVQVTPPVQVQDANSQKPAEPEVFKTEEVRKALDQLSDAIEEDESEFSGCLLPIRVRLVRADQSVFERDGCRSDSGWPGVASRLVSKLVR